MAGRKVTVDGRSVTRLTRETVESLEQLLSHPEAAQALLTPRQRAVTYTASLVRRYRRDCSVARRVRFDATTVDSVKQLLKRFDPARPDPRLALGLQYLRDHVALYESPERREAREREVARVRSYQHKEVEGG